MLAIKSVLKGGVTLLLVSGSLAYAETISYDFDDIGVVRSGNPVPHSMEGVRQRILEQDERIDGLTTVIEGLSASFNELRAINIDESPTPTPTPQPEEGHAEILQKLANMIDEINDNYVSKKEVQAMLEKFRLELASKKTKAKEDQQEQSNKSSAVLYREGVRDFSKKRYAKAKEAFTQTAKQGHKPAASNYYLGEIAYYSDQPTEAIYHFKKSAELYGEASYMDTLLLHTAISLAKTGEKGQAKAFFENIIATYPEKKSATIAKERLEKL
jgi:TolA-binding protein